MRSLVALLLVPIAALAQNALPTDFPTDALPASADGLRTLIAGNVFHVRPADGSSWRIDYRANGYAFLDTGTGFRDTGTWRVEDGRLCTEWRKASSGCSEARLRGSSIYIRRESNREVVVLEAAR
jgi:hypothetical protein